MKKLLILFMVSSALTLSGCNDKSEETKSVSFYKNNTEKMLIQIAKCNENPGELMSTPNCINALSATKQKSIGSVDRDMSKSFD
jgi:protein involved in sex pheromone biosynthesis